MIRLSLPLSKSKQSHMRVSGCSTQVWHDSLTQKGFGNAGAEFLRYRHSLSVDMWSPSDNHRDDLVVRIEPL
jgi:hypothetical protein